MATRKRAQAKRPRDHFLYTDVTEGEYKTIRRYCRDIGVSISQFFADLLLKEANKHKTNRPENVTLTIEVTPAQHERLELLSRLHKKKSVSDFVREALEPKLKVQRLHASVKTKLVRYYLSAEEHAKLRRHLTKLGMSVRNYPAMLALETIGKARKKRK